MRLTLTIFLHQPLAPPSNMGQVLEIVRKYALIFMILDVQQMQIGIKEIGNFCFYEKGVCQGKEYVYFVHGKCQWTIEVC